MTFRNPAGLIAFIIGTYTPGILISIWLLATGKGFTAAVAVGIIAVFLTVLTTVLIGGRLSDNSANNVDTGGNNW